MKSTMKIIKKLTIVRKRQKTNKADNNGYDHDNQQLLLQHTDLVKNGGKLLNMLPEEILHKICAFLEVDYFYYLSQLNHMWNA